MSTKDTIGGAKEGSALLTPLFILLFTVGIIVALLLSTCALTNCNEKGDPLIEIINGLLVISKTNTDQIGLLQTLIIQTRDNAVERDTALEEYDITITTEISNINKKIDARFPQAGQTDDTSQSGMGTTTPTITINLVSDIFYRGNTIEITGQVGPREQVEAIIDIPDTNNILTPNVRADGNGSYVIRFFTTLNDAIGDYTVYVEVNNQQSEILRFELK